MLGTDHDTYVPLRSARDYEIRRPVDGDGYIVVDGAGKPAVVIRDLGGTATTSEGTWRWKLIKEGLGWRLVLRQDDHEREVLRVAPRGELVKYRMQANCATVAKLLLNPLTQRWRLYERRQTLARIAVNPRFYGRGTVRPGPAAQPAGAIQLGALLPNQPTRSALLLGTLLCIRFDASYAGAGGGSSGP